MFGNKEPAKPQNRIDSLIGAGTTVQGNIQFSDGLRVDGRVHGNIVSTGDQPGMLVISEHAEVLGEIRVNHVMVNGRVNGPIHASESLDLQSKAHVTGDVYYRRLEIHGGAVVQGMMVCDTEAQADNVVSIKPLTADSNT